MRVAPSPFARVMPERRSLFCLLKLVRVFLVFEAPRLLAGLATGAGGCPTPHNPCCSEDVAMRYDFSPLYRSTVGFDRLLDVPRPGDRGRGGPAPGPRDPRLQAELRSRRSREGRGRQLDNGLLTIELKR